MVKSTQWKPTLSEPKVCADVFQQPVFRSVSSPCFQELKVVGRPQKDGTGRRLKRSLAHCLDPWPCQTEQGVGPRGAHAVRRAAAVRGAAAPTLPQDKAP